MNGRKKYYASVSFGKDSLAMLYMLIEKQCPLDEVVFYNSGVEFECLYDTRQQVLPMLENLGIKYTELKPKDPFLWSMLEKPVRKQGTDIIHKKGYSWCGGVCRWGTSDKLNAIKKHIGNNYDYVGIAADEKHRFTKYQRENRILPLVDWGVTEPQALQFCYDLGFRWEEFGIPLYEILDRVSCWCCGNKNLKELYNIYLHLPYYWEKLKEIQSKTDRPYRRQSLKTIFDLEIEFEEKKLSGITKNVTFTEIPSLCI